MNLKNVIPASIIILLIPVVLLGASAQDVLRRAETADKRLNYKGVKITTVHFADEAVTSKLKVTHLRPNMTRTEYFSPAALAGIVVLQDGINFWKFHPREDAWERMCPKVILSDESECHGFLNHFDLKITGVEKIAGRPAYVVCAIPKRGVESAHRVWVDKEYYIVTGTQAENPDGTVVNSSRYINIEVNPQGISPSLFKVSGRVKQVSEPNDVTFRLMKPSYVPPGYRLIGITSMMVNDFSCAHLQFSNGVNSISLFEHKINTKRQCPPIRSKITNVLDWNYKGFSLTLMSDLSMSELRKIAKSIH